MRAVACRSDEPDLVWACGSRYEAGEGASPAPSLWDPVCLVSCLFLPSPLWGGGHKA